MNKDVELMINKVIDLMMMDQKDSGVLSKNIECEAEDKQRELLIEAKEKTSKETYTLFLKLEDYLIELLALYEERAYKTGFRDGIKLMNSINQL